MVRIKKKQSPVQAPAGTADPPSAVVLSATAVSAVCCFYCFLVQSPVQAPAGTADSPSAVVLSVTAVSALFAVSTAF